MAFNAKYVRKGVKAITSIEEGSVLRIRGSGTFTTSTRGNVIRTGSGYRATKYIERGKKCTLNSLGGSGKAASNYGTHIGLPPPIFNNDFTRLSALNKNFPHSLNSSSRFISHEDTINETIKRNGGTVLTNASIDVQEDTDFTQEEAKGFSPTMVRDQENFYDPEFNEADDENLVDIGVNEDSPENSGTDMDLADAEIMRSDTKRRAQLLNITEEEAFEGLKAQLDQENVDDDNYIDKFIKTPEKEIWGDAQERVFDEYVNGNDQDVEENENLEYNRLSADSKSLYNNLSSILGGDSKSKRPLSPQLRPIRERRPTLRTQFTSFKGKSYGDSRSPQGVSGSDVGYRTPRPSSFRKPTSRRNVMLKKNTKVLEDEY